MARPKTGKARTLYCLRLGPSAQLIQKMADRETGGNFSEMVRRLLSEAISARGTKGPRA